ncbi:MAG: glycosyltransferase, partial [Acetobacteraceae bacterium]|nr:glycosyltransferase [Acetobacteraceae bacterium]
DALRTQLGARHVVPLYGWVDPDQYVPATPRAAYAGVLSYIGTYAADRQAALEKLLIEPARRLPAEKFVIAGAQYPAAFPWTPNIFFVRHLPPPEHPIFYASSRATLNVTRAPMARMGWCPSGRLFEAAACGATVLSDWWEGLGAFFIPGDEILVAQSTDDILGALSMSDAELRRIGQHARERALSEHSARHRAAQLLAALDGVKQRARAA